MGLYVIQTCLPVAPLWVRCLYHMCSTNNPEGHSINLLFSANESPQVSSICTYVNISSYADYCDVLDHGLNGNWWEYGRVLYGLADNLVLARENIPAELVIKIPHSCSGHFISAGAVHKGPTG